MKQVVIFDLDGTLADSIASIKFCGDACVAPFGYGPFSPQQYKYFVGDGAANLVKRMLIAGGDENLIHFEEAYATYRSLFAVHSMDGVEPYEGIRELIAALKEKGLKICVFSNKPHAETVTVIETLFGKGVFDECQGQKENVPIKPAPDGAVAMLKRLNIAAADALYLGDTATDMKTGKSLGAFTIGALWGFREINELKEGGADAIIAHPLEVLNYL